MILMHTDSEAVKPIFGAYDVMRTLLMTLMREYEQLVLRHIVGIQVTY